MEEILAAPIVVGSRFSRLAGRECGFLADRRDVAGIQNVHVALLVSHDHTPLRQEDELLVRHGKLASIRCAEDEWTKAVAYSATNIFKIHAVKVFALQGELSRRSPCGARPSISGGHELKDKAEGGRAVLEAIFAAYESAGSGRKVPLPFKTAAAKPHDLWKKC